MTVFEFEEFLEESKRKFKRYIDGFVCIGKATFEVCEEIKMLTNDFELQTLYENLIEMREMAS